MARKLYKTTLVIWSEFDPNKKEMDIDELADAAVSGDAYCSSNETVKVEDVEDDPDYDGSEFFDTSDVGEDMDDADEDEEFLGDEEEEDDGEGY